MTAERRSSSSVNLLEQVDRFPNKQLNDSHWGEAKRNKNCNGKRVLDYHLLCDAGGVDEPSKLRHVDLKGAGLKQVNSETFEQFTSLRSINLTSNFVPLETLALFPALQNACLQRNHIMTVNLLAEKFGALQELDISYNKLKAVAMLALASLPALRRLNVDYNLLGKIPEEAGEKGAFPSLQKLSAAGNGLHSSSLIPLSKIRRLESLSLSQNSISSIPEKIFSWARPFRRLKELDLSFNCLKEPYTLVSLRQLQHLHKVILWGNPIAKNVGKSVLQAFLQARKRGQSWALEAPPPPRPPYQRFSSPFRQEPYLLDEADLQKQQDVAKPQQEKALQTPSDQGPAETAESCSFGASVAFLCLKRELAFPPTPADFDPPHYFTGPKRPASTPSLSSTKDHPSLMERVRKVQRQKDKQRTDIMLKDMHDRLKVVESGLSGLESTLTALCKS